MLFRSYQAIWSSSRSMMGSASGNVVLLVFIGWRFYLLLLGKRGKICPLPGRLAFIVDLRRKGTMRRGNAPSGNTWPPASTMTEDRCASSFALTARPHGHSVSSFLDSVEWRRVAWLPNGEEIREEPSTVTLNEFFSHTYGSVSSEDALAN